MASFTTKIGKRGTIVIPAPLRQKYGLNEGSQIDLRAHPDGLIMRPVVTLPIEIYTSERKAEFLLNNTTSRKEYEKAIQKVKEMGLDPNEIPHEKPKSVKKIN